MLRHIALFRLKKDAPKEATQSLESGLFQLAQVITEMSSYDYGADLGLREGKFDFGVAADFEDAASFERYVNHPEHQTFIRERLTPVVEERVSIQFEL